MNRDVNVKTFVLCIEASTDIGSVALIDSSILDCESECSNRAALLIASIDVKMGSGTGDGLTPAVFDILTNANIRPNQIVGVICSSGPGSFTSLRIAASFVKGFIAGTGALLYPIPSLMLVANGMHKYCSPGSYVVVSDALRGDVYAQRITLSDSGTISGESEFFRLNQQSINEFAGVDIVVQVGVGTGRFIPNASGIVWVNECLRFGPVSPDAWEPNYGRLAEAQVKWEEANGRQLPSS